MYHFSSLYNIDIVRLRYFNVFGPYQNPNSEYSAVIPKFISCIMRGDRPIIYGDGSQSRDFTFVDNVVDANLKACVPVAPISGAYNIAFGASSSILDIATSLCTFLDAPVEFDFEPGRLGDVLNSWASVDKAKSTFNFDPVVDLYDGLSRTVDWYNNNL